MGSFELRQMIHPRLRYERVELADSENALGPWTEGMAAVAMLEELDELVWQGEECDCEQPECPCCHPLDASAYRERVTQVITANARAIELFELGLARGKLQVQLRPPELHQLVDLTGIRSFSRLCSIQGKLALLQGDSTQACEHYLQGLKLANLVAQDDGLILDWILSVGIMRAATSRLAELVEEHVLPLDQLARIEAELAQADLRRTAVLALRSELGNWLLPILESIERHSRDETLAKVTTHLFTPWEALQSPVVDPADRAHGEACRRAFLRLLDGHPNPWDAREVLHACNWRFVQALAGFAEDDALWSESNEQLAEWDERQRASAAFEVVRETATDDLMPTPPLEILSDEELDRLAVGAREIPNLAGVLFEAHSQPGISSRLLEPISECPDETNAFRGHAQQRLRRAIEQQRQR